MEKLQNKIYLKNAYRAVKDPGVEFNPAFAQSVPYAVTVAGIDLTGNLDRDPNVTSLPTGTYYGVAYTHSDNTLCARYPKVAAALRPMAEHVAAQYYTANDPIIIALLLDSIGCVIANSASAYNIANNLKRTLNSVQYVDEDNLYIGGLLNHTQERGHVKDEGIGYMYEETAWTDYPGWRQNFHLSYTKFDSKYNSAITRLWLSPTMKAFIKAFGGSFIKLRDVDSDTDRYLTLWEDELIAEFNHLGVAYPDIDTFSDKFDEYVANVDTVTNRFTYIKNILKAYGVELLTPDDTLVFARTGNKFEYIVDSSDDFKNLIDHKGLTLTEFEAYQEGKIPEGTFDYIFYEESSYFQNLLNQAEGLVLEDSSMAVFFGSENIRLYELCGTVVHKQGNSSYRKFFNAYPKNWTPNNADQLSGPNMYDLFKQLAVLHTVGAVDSTFVTEIKFTNHVTADATMDGNGVLVWPGLNTYVSNKEDMWTAKSNAIRLTFFNDDSIKKTNAGLAGDSSDGQTAL